jgi:glycosyltransferase involved in cell wall biosynthesis
VAVLFDLQGVQSRAHGERGIARYVGELAAAIARDHADRVSFLLNPDLPFPPTIEPLAGRARLARSDAAPPADASVLHVGSPFEDVSIERLWPAWAHRRGMRLAVTLYDLIPAVFPEIYLAEQPALRWYKGRLAFVRNADRILAISEATARDAVERLSVNPEKVVVVGAGVSEKFRPPRSHADAFTAVRAAVPELEPGYVLYTGGIEPRKNLDRLLSAYAALPEGLRVRHPLVVVCRVMPREREALKAQLRELGIAGRVWFPGFVADDALVTLYQACALFVFPSLYEGFGLPIAEAMACRAPVIAARTSSLTELVTEEAALFDPRSVRSIRETMERCLADEALRMRLGEHRLPDRYRWPRVAERTVAVYDELEHLRRRPRRRRLRIAYVSPLPPQRSGIAEYSFRLLAELVEHCDVDAFVDGAFEGAQAPPGVPIARVERFTRARRARGGYDGVIYALGNSEFHAQALALLRREPGVVLAHDVRLTGLYAWCAARRPDLEPRRFHDILQEMYGDRVPPEVVAHGWLDLEDADRLGVYMAREVIGRSERYLVHSHYAAQLARLDADPRDQEKIDTTSFAFPAPEGFQRDESSRGPIVATFGMVAEVKQITKIMEAFRHLSVHHPDAVLGIVGPFLAEGERERYVRQAAELDIGDRVRITGELDPARFRTWLNRCTVAVQLRSASNGESPASVADCLAAGAPTIVTSLGAAREFPDDCVVSVERAITPEALSDTISQLLADSRRRKALSAAGRAYAGERSFKKVAASLYEKAVLRRDISRAA